jgi:hypothetical protein
VLGVGCPVDLVRYPLVHERTSIRGMIRGIHGARRFGVTEGRLELVEGQEVGSLLSRWAIRSRIVRKVCNDVKGKYVRHDSPSIQDIRLIITVP